jgi:hypothetical protein
MADMHPIQYKLKLIKEGVSLDTLSTTSSNFDVMNAMRLSLYETLTHTEEVSVLTEADGPSAMDKIKDAIKALIQRITAFFSKMTAQLKANNDPRQAFVKKNLSILKAYKAGGLYDTGDDHLPTISIPKNLSNTVNFSKFYSTVDTAVKYCDEIVAGKSPTYPFRSVAGRHEPRHTSEHIASDMMQAIFGGFATADSVMSSVYGNISAIRVDRLPDVPKLADLFLSDYEKGLDKLHEIAPAITTSLNRAINASSQHVRDPKDPASQTVEYRDHRSALYGAIDAYNAIIKLVHSFISTVMYGYNMIYKVLHAAVSYVKGHGTAGK